MNVLKFLDQLNITPPAELSLAGQLRAAVNAAATTNPVGDLEADILEGKVSPKQAQARVADCARTLTERDKAREVARDLEPVFVRLSKRALLASGDDLIASMRPAFDDAVAVVINATEVLGPNPDNEQVGQLGPAASVLWHQRRDAGVTLTAVHRVRLALSDVGYGPTSAAAYLAESQNTPHLEQAGRVFHANSNGIVNLAAAGYTLRLNTAAETAAIEASARLATETADQAIRDAALAEVRARTAPMIADLKAMAVTSSKAKVSS